MEHAVRWEWIEIPRSEITNYGSTTMGDVCKAKIAYNRDGAINVFETYSDSYRRRHHLGEFAPKKDDSSNKTSGPKSSPKPSGRSSSKTEDKEEHVPQPISAYDRDYLNSCFSFPEEDHVYQTVAWLYEHYFYCRNISTEIDSDLKLKNSAMEHIKDTMCEIEIPSDYGELFGLVVVVTYFHDKEGGFKSFGDNVFGGLNVTKQSRNSLYTRLESIIVGSKSRFYTQDAYDFISIMPAEYYDNIVFSDVCRHYSEELLSKNTQEALYQIIELCKDVQCRIYSFNNALKEFPLPTGEQDLLSLHEKLVNASDYLEPIKDDTNVSIYYLNEKITDCEKNICELRINQGTPDDLKNLFDSVPQFKSIKVASYINRFPVPSNEQTLESVVSIFKAHDTKEELKKYREKIEEIQSVIKEKYTSNEQLMSWCESQDKALTMIDAKKYQDTRLYSAIGLAVLSLVSLVFLPLIIVAIVLWIGWYMVFFKNYSERIPKLRQWAEAYEKSLKF